MNQAMERKVFEEFETGLGAQTSKTFPKWKNLNSRSQRESSRPLVQVSNLWRCSFSLQIGIHSALIPLIETYDKRGSLLYSSILLVCMTKYNAPIFPGNAIEKLKRRFFTSH